MWPSLSAAILARKSILALGMTGPTDSAQVMPVSPPVHEASVVGFAVRGILADSLILPAPTLMPAAFVVSARSARSRRLLANVVGATSPGRSLTTVLVGLAAARTPPECRDGAGAVAREPGARRCNVARAGAARRVVATQES